MRTHIAIAGLILCTFAPSTGWSQVPPFVKSWGSFGRGSTQFLTPVGVAVDADGIVYVVDSNLHSLKRFTGGGIYLSEWPVTYPAGVALDASGYVYVTQFYANVVSKFTKSGTLVAQWSAIGSGIAADADGSVYVAGVDQLLKFSSSGTLLSAWGGPGTANGQFSGLDGVAVDGQGHVYTAEFLGSRIQKFTTSGTYLTQWGIFGSGNGQFNYPVRLATNPNGDLVYVVDNRNERVQVFTTSGDYLGQWGTAGNGPGQFLNPIGIALDAHGNVFVADTNNSRIQAFGDVATPTRLMGWGHLKSLYR